MSFLRLESMKKYIGFLGFVKTSFPANSTSNDNTKYISWFGYSYFDYPNPVSTR